MLVQGFIMSNLAEEYKLFFWKSEANIETFQKLLSHIGVPYKLVLGSIKSLNRIFWVIEYWYKAQKCKIWSTNAKLFFWKSEANLEASQKICSQFVVSYKFLLKSVKSLNQTWAIEYQRKFKKAKFRRRMNTKPFFWDKPGKLWNFPKTFLPYWISL